MKALHEVRNYPSGFMVWEDCYENMGFLAHWHREVELIYVREGKAAVTVGDAELKANAGDLIVVDTGDFHYSQPPNHKNQLDFILFDPSVIGPYYHHAHFFTPLVTSELLKKYGLASALLSLFDTVREELDGEGLYYREIVSAKLQEFMYQLRRRHQSSQGASELSHRTSTLHDIQRLMLYIDQHYQEPLTLDAAAEELNLSRSHFSQLFSNVVGINFLSYVNTVRIENAAHMLQSSDQKVIDVAMSCGFENIRSFNRCFKQYTGYTPTQFLALPEQMRRSFTFYKRKLEKKEYVQGVSTVVMLNDEQQ